MYDLKKMVAGDACFTDLTFMPISQIRTTTLTKLPLIDHDTITPKQHISTTENNKDPEKKTDQQQDILKSDISINSFLEY